MKVLSEFRLDYDTYLRVYQATGSPDCIPIAEDDRRYFVLENNKNDESDIRTDETFDSFGWFTRNG